jgi:hypothetical protein
METSSDTRGDARDRGNDRLVLACVAAGSLVAGAGLFWATKQVLDYYIPYQVRGGPGKGGALGHRQKKGAHTDTPPAVPLPPGHAQRMAGQRAEQVLEATET